MYKENTRVMGIDFGKKRTGIALSDEACILGSPFDTIVTGDSRELVHKVVKIVLENEVGKIVVGLPLNHRGEQGKDAETVQTFIALLREKTAVPVIEWDERFTTLQAERTLLTANMSREKRKQVIDKIAACLILQTYLDSIHFKSALDSEFKGMPGCGEE